MVSSTKKVCIFRVLCVVTIISGIVSDASIMPLAYSLVCMVDDGVLLAVSGGTESLVDIDVVFGISVRGITVLCHFRKDNDNDKDPCSVRVMKTLVV